MYEVRFCDITGTPWRRAAETRPQTAFQNTEKFDSFYTAFEGQVPEELAQRIFERSTVGIREPGGTLRDCGDFDRIEVVLFSLPFPANQVVATLVLDFKVASIVNEEESVIAALLKGAADGRIHIDGRLVSEIADELAISVEAKPTTTATDRPLTGHWERHALVFADGNAMDEKEADQEIRGLLFGIRWPYRSEFTTVQRPADLNREDGSYAAVSDHASFCVRQPDVVENSILLTTVQAVGTAARFQSIWRDAYRQVTLFQSSKQRPSGLQTREGLEGLADELGDLELDLAFSVETVADLGLGSTTAQIDAFHHALYEAMQIKTRATTVGQMFVRLNGSIRSELTAIESREMKLADTRRARGAIMLGVLTFLLAPLAVVLGFFGVNAREVAQNETMFNLGRYWPIYAFALLMMITSVTFALTFDPSTLRRARRTLRRRKTGK